LAFLLDLRFLSVIINYGEEIIFRYLKIRQLDKNHAKKRIFTIFY